MVLCAILPRMLRQNVALVKRPGGECPPGSFL